MIYVILAVVCIAGGYILGCRYPAARLLRQAADKVDIK